jgi:predicted O-linked N-acetylglucosamine transferase (SPINDLY family)
MTDTAYVTALQRIVDCSLQLGELVEIAGQLSVAGRSDQARQLYQVWLKHNDSHPLAFVAFFNRSALDSQAGDTAAATTALQGALARNPDFVPAYINLGSILERAGAAEKAVELWRTGAARQQAITGMSVSHVVTALKQIARVMSDRQQIEAAEAAVQQCLDIAPEQGDLIEQFVALRLAQCKWPVVTGSDRLTKKAVVRGIHPLSTAVYSDDPLLQLSSADRYVRQAGCDGLFDPTIDRRHAPTESRFRRMRVGYVSSDLRDHAVGYLMAEFFEIHNRDRVEVFAYYCGPESNSALTQRIKGAVEHWRDIRKMTDEEAARLVASDEIDILVDVNGHTRDARTGVFARRPAPVIVNWLGYPGTMGTPYHHYIVADDWIIPEAHEKYYSEKVLRLPCYQPNDRKRVVAEDVPTRVEAGLPEDGFVFCCFNGTHKISRFTFNRWMEILRRVPGSVLWLLDTTAETKARLRRMSEEQGVDGARLVFAPKMANAQHLARYRLADLFLDTAPYGAHTTASDALWMAVPVLTLSGRSFASRVCGSLVRAAGHPELVTLTPEQYVAKAVDIGLNPAKAAAFRSSLQRNRGRCTLFNMNLLVERMEELYRQMCDEHERGRLPQPDLVNLDRYLDVATSLDHEEREMLAEPDYEAIYRRALAQAHLSRPIAPDFRLWSTADIAMAERQIKAAGSAQPLQPSMLPSIRRLAGRR